MTYITCTDSIRFTTKTWKNECCRYTWSRSKSVLDEGLHSITKSILICFLGRGYFLWIHVTKKIRHKVPKQSFSLDHWDMGNLSKKLSEILFFLEFESTTIDQWDDCRGTDINFFAKIDVRPIGVVSLSGIRRLKKYLLILR